jgi:hypothetical protein
MGSRASPPAPSSVYLRRWCSLDLVTCGSRCCRFCRRRRCRGCTRSLLLRLHLVRLRGCEMSKLSQRSRARRVVAEAGISRPRPRRPRRVYPRRALRSCPRLRFPSRLGRRGRRWRQGWGRRLGWKERCRRDGRFASVSTPLNTDERGPVSCFGAASTACCPLPLCRCSVHMRCARRRRGGGGAAPRGAGQVPPHPTTYF